MKVVHIVASAVCRHELKLPLRAVLDVSVPGHMLQGSTDLLRGHMHRGSVMKYGVRMHHQAWPCLFLLLSIGRCGTGGADARPQRRGGLCCSRCGSRPAQGGAVSWLMREMRQEVSRVRG